MGLSPTEQWDRSTKANRLVAMLVNRATKGQLQSLDLEEMERRRWQVGTNHLGVSPRKLRLVRVAAARLVADQFYDNEEREAVLTGEEYADSGDKEAEEAMWRDERAIKWKAEHYGVGEDKETHLSPLYTTALNCVEDNPNISFLELLRPSVDIGASYEVKLVIAMKDIIDDPFNLGTLNEVCLHCGSDTQEPEVDYACCGKCGRTKFGVPWRTETVLKVAQDAYTFRLTQTCPRCAGAGTFVTSNDKEKGFRSSIVCEVCKGVGALHNPEVTDDYRGFLDPFRLDILCDALEDAGCSEPRIIQHLRHTKVNHWRGCWALDLVLGRE